MFLAGLILLIVSAVAAIPLFDQGALEWLTESSTCNDRPCTEEESKTIAAVVSGGSGVTGIVLLAVGLGRAIRGRSETPDLADTVGASSDDYGARMEAVARLDEAYGRGEVNEEAYLRRKRKLMP